MTDSGRVLAKQLVARELGNANLGRQLHDGVSQVLSAAGLQLELLRMEAGDSPLASRIGAVQQTLETAVNQVRSISHDLNPHTIERVGLRLTLQDLIREVEPSYSGTYELVCPERLTLPRQEALALALCLIESLRTAVLVTGAKKITLRCRESRKGVSCKLHLAGGTQDLELKQSPTLLLAREYAMAAGYYYTLETKLGRDTIITVGHATPES